VIAISALHWAFSLAVVRLARGSALDFKIVEATARPISLAWPWQDWIWCGGWRRTICGQRTGAALNTLLLSSAHLGDRTRCAPRRKGTARQRAGADMWTMRRVPDAGARVFTHRGGCWCGCWASSPR